MKNVEKSTTLLCFVAIMWLPEFHLILLKGFLFVFTSIASSVGGVAIAQVIDTYLIQILVSSIKSGIVNALTLP